MQFRSIKFFIAASATAAALSAATSPAIPAGGAFSCQTPASKGYASTDLKATSSTSYVNLSSTSVSINQGNGKCLIVIFTGQVTNTPNSFMEVRPLLDGQATSIPDGATLYAGSSFFEEPRTQTFVFLNVAAGNHNIRMQYRSRNGSFVAITKYTTLVMYSP